MLLKTLWQQLGTRPRLLQGFGNGRHRTQLQQELDWRHALSKELDAGVGHLTYDDAFMKLGEPQLTLVNRDEIVAIWLSGRLGSKWVPINRPWLKRLFVHGSRLELVFNGSTRLISWKYTDW